MEDDTSVDAVTNMISGHVVDAALKVHKTLGPGLLERAYAACLAEELRMRGRNVAVEVPVSLSYGRVEISNAYRLDMLVDDRVIVEVKSVKQADPIHLLQLMTYLKLTGRRVGLLINFNVPFLRDGIHRRVR